MPTTFTCAPRTDLRARRHLQGGEVDHVRRLALEQRAHVVGPRHVGRDERDPAQLVRCEQRGHAPVVRACVRGDDLHALVDEPAQDPRADAAVGAGDEEPLAHAATTGFCNGATPPTVTSTTSPGGARPAGRGKCRPRPASP